MISLAFFTGLSIHSIRRYHCRSRHSSPSVRETTVARRVTADRRSCRRSRPGHSLSGEVTIVAHWHRPREKQRTSEHDWGDYEESAIRKSLLLSYLRTRYTRLSNNSNQSSNHSEPKVCTYNKHQHTQCAIIEIRAAFGFRIISAATITSRHLVPSSVTPIGLTGVTLRDSSVDVTASTSL